MQVKINKCLIFIDNGNINKNGRIYPPGRIKLSHNPLPVTYNFKEPKIGDVIISRDSENRDEIYGDFFLYPKTKDDAKKLIEKFIGTFPAIKGMINTKDKKSKEVDNLELLGVSICTGPNNDPRIQPILRHNMIIVEEEQGESHEEDHAIS